MNLDAFFNFNQLNSSQFSVKKKEGESSLKVNNTANSAFEQAILDFDVTSLVGHSHEERENFVRNLNAIEIEESPVKERINRLYSLVNFDDFSVAEDMNDLLEEGDLKSLGGLLTYLHEATKHFDDALGMFVRQYRNQFGKLCSSLVTMGVEAGIIEKMGKLSLKYQQEKAFFDHLDIFLEAGISTDSILESTRKTYLPRVVHRLGLVPKQRKELAFHLVDQAPASVGNHFENFQIQDEETRYKLLLEVHKKSEGVAIANFEKFKIDNSKHPHHEILEKFFENEVSFSLLGDEGEHLKQFEVDRKSLDMILLASIRSKESGNEALRNFEKLGIPKKQHQSYLNQLIKVGCYEEIAENFHKLKIDNQKELIPLIRDKAPGAFYANRYKFKLNKKQIAQYQVEAKAYVKKLVEEGAGASIFKEFRGQALEGTGIKEVMSDLRKMVPAQTTKTYKMILLKMLVTKENWEEENSYALLQKATRNQLMDLEVKDHPFHELLQKEGAEELMKIIWEAEKQENFVERLNTMKSIFPDVDSTQENLDFIKIVLRMPTEFNFQEPITLDQLNQQMTEYLNQLIFDGKSDPDVLQKFLKENKGSRDPTAILRYLALLKSEGYNNDAVSALEAARIFAQALIEGEDTAEYGPVLDFLKEDKKNTNFLKAWAKGANYSAEDLLDEGSEFTIDHLTADNFELITISEIKPFLDRLKYKDEIDLVSFRKGPLKEAKKNKKKDPQRYIELAQVDNLLAIVTKTDPMEQIQLMKRIRDNFSDGDKEAFLAMVKGKRVLPEFSCEDNNDRDDRQLQGTDVISCMRIDQDSSQTNCCLAVRLITGENRLLAVKENGRIVGRALCRMLLDADGKPVALVEKFYNREQRKDVELFLGKLVAARAKEWGVPVVTVNNGKGKPYGKGPVETLPGKYPQYFDSKGGRVPDGKVSIDNACLFDPAKL